MTGSTHADGGATQGATGDAALDGARVLVMGLGRFGGGLGVVRWLAGRGALVTVTDLADEEALVESVTALRPLVATGRVALRLGGHDERDFEATDLVVAGPAVPRPWENRYLAAAARAGRPITTEMRLLVERLDRRRVIGVTGSAGKSTTSAMTAHVLRGLGVPVRFGGNIGGSLLGELETLGAEERVVLELSSFMLHWLGAGVGAPGAAGWSPGVAAITNIAPNHLDWHGTLAHYRACKEGIGRHQGAGDVLLRGGPEGDVAAPRELPSDAPLRLPGAHNAANARLAVRLACAATGATPAAAAATLHDFAGLPHRLELVADVDGRRCFNDSKSTTPAATLVAVEAFADPARVHLIAGGYDKGSDLAPIAALGDRLGGLYAIGATAATIAGDRPERNVQTVARAVETAAARMRPGDVLLLSPGCASWDQFANYEARGEAFRAAVAQMFGTG